MSSFSPAPSKTGCEMKKLVGLVLGAWIAVVPVGTGAIAQTAATYQLTDGASTVHQVHGFTCPTSLLCLAHVPIDSTGAAFGVAGNPFMVSPGTGAVFHTVCDSGCGGSGGTSSNFGSTFPTPGTAVGMSQGGNMVALTGTSNNLNVNCAAGCAGGTFNNNADAVSTSSSNEQTAAWLYGWNGSTFDRLQVDGSKNLKTTFSNSSITANAGTNLNTSLLALEGGGNLASLVTQLGAVTASPTANTVLDRLKSINTTLGSPFQAGGSIGNTAFGISGTLPAFAATPTVNLGTIAGVATQTTLASVLSALGSPFQAGGSIGNTSFAATQATASALNATVVGTGTFAVQLSGASNNINNISGTISLPTGAATSANQILTQAPIAPATATATKSDLIGGQFDTTQKTLTNGQQAAYSMSARGAMFVAVGADGFAVTNGGTFAVQAAQSGTWNIGSITTLPALVAGSAIVGKVGFDQTTPGTTNGVQVNSSALPTGAATSANQAAPNTASVTNPTSTLALTSATTAYGINQLVATSATAGSVVVPSFTIPNTAGAISISDLVLTVNDSISTGWGGQGLQVDLWRAAPTFTNGDRGAYAVATGSANYIGSFSGTMAPVAGDGAYGRLTITSGNGAHVKLASGASVFWTLQTLTGTGGVVTASKTFTLTAEPSN